MIIDLESHTQRITRISRGFLYIVIVGQVGVTIRESSGKLRIFSVSAKKGMQFFILIAIFLLIYLI